MSLIPKFAIGKKVRYNGILHGIFTHHDRIGRIEDVLPGNYFKVSFDNGRKPQLMLIISGIELQSIENTDWIPPKKCLCHSYDLLHKGCTCGHFQLSSEDCVGEEEASRLRKEMREHEKQLEDSKPPAKIDDIDYDILLSGYSAYISEEDTVD